MLGGYGLKRSGTMPAIVRQRLTALPRSSRSISSFRPQGSKFQLRHGGLNQTLSGNLSWRATSALPGLASARFNSTSAATTANETLADTPSDFSDLSNFDIGSMSERIGYLKDMGLDYGWGPSSVIEYIIEHLHIWGGLPWWASIIGTGLLIRLALVKPMMDAADTGARIHNLKHITTPLRAKIMIEGRNGNHAGSQAARFEMNKVHAQHGVQAWRSFVPMIQIPFGYGCYRVVKGMAALPIPGLAAEHFGWITDLTVADPTFILPLATSYMMYKTFKKGGESGLSELQNTSFGKLFFYGLPAITFAFTAFFPSALQLYFATTGLFGLGQAYLINNPAFRRWANIAIADKSISASGEVVQEHNNAIRMMKDAVAAEKERIRTSQASTETQNLSFIDRVFKSGKDYKNQLARETSDKMAEYSGKGPAKNADGSTAAPPRLSDKDLKLAADYERRRKEEEDWKREERNHARREAHMKALEAEREKARSSFKPKQK